MRDEPADLVVLDLMLPGHRRPRGVPPAARATATYPIIMLTALGAETDRVVGLERGADDYVTKPFSPRELVLRVDSVLRRAGERRPAAADAVVDGDLVVDPARHVATLGGARARADRRASSTCCASWSPTRASRTPATSCCSEVWGWSFGDQSTVTVHVRRLREKVEADPTTPDAGW